MHRMFKDFAFGNPANGAGFPLLPSYDGGWINLKNRTFHLPLKADILTRYKPRPRARERPLADSQDCRRSSGPIHPCFPEGSTVAVAGIIVLWQCDGRKRRRVRKPIKETFWLPSPLKPAGFSAVICPKYS